MREVRRTKKMTPRAQTSTANEKGSPRSLSGDKKGKVPPPPTLSVLGSTTQAHPKSASLMTCRSSACSERQAACDMSRERGVCSLVFLSHFSVPDKLTTFS